MLARKLEAVTNLPRSELDALSAAPTQESHHRSPDSDRADRSRLNRLLKAVEHVAHLLPMQGPIGVFVHHNTLHAFQDLPFEKAVIEASRVFGTEPYMAEAAYRAELARGRIQIEDIDGVLDS